MTAIESQTEELERAPDVNPPTQGRTRALLIFCSVLAVIAGAGVLYWLHARQFEETDDAYVEMHLNPISPRIDGDISRIYVEDNQLVRAGDPLVDLDRRDYELAASQAKAALAQARSLLTGQIPNIPITEIENATGISVGEASVANARAALAAAEQDVDSASARLSEAEATNARAQADLGRYKILIAREEVSQQEYDQIAATAAAQAASLKGSKAALESASHTVDQRRAQVLETETRLRQVRETSSPYLSIRRAAVRSQEANSLAASTQVEQAELKVGYTKIVSPVTGVVMKRSAEIGAHVSAGQQLLTIAQIGDVWVTANFKETQLIGIASGQTARIHVDALNRSFDGYVENIGGGTGAISSVLPPENATGNFVKVVQRIPVRLRFKRGQPGIDLLRAGMSVEPEVWVAR